MQSTSQSSTPSMYQAHPKRNLVIGLLVIGVIAIIAIVFCFFFKKQQRTGPLTDKEKTELIAELKQSGAVVDPTLSEEQLSQLIKQTGTKPQKSELTDEQKAEIIRQANQ